MPTLTIQVQNSLANLNYLIYCPHTRHCLVVDPLDTEKILHEAQSHQLTITHIVNTHEHGDHTGGNTELKEKTAANIMAHHGAQHLIPGFDTGVQAGDSIKIGSEINLTVLETPGHTMHSICLYDERTPSLYTGDTLFNCGCGNCHNGGDPEIMFTTFESQLQHLPDETLIYPGHDYIRNNLNFAKSFQPELPAIKKIEQQLSTDHIHISTLAEDKTVDPFFRLDDPELITAIRMRIELPAHPTRKDVFLALRRLRNQW